MPAPHHPDLVSTIIPVHNRPDLLTEAVASVLAQSWRPIEILIVDDGSTDRTAEVADRLAAEHPGVIRVFHQLNGGPGRARQRGLEEARGSFVQFLDSDDLLLPEKFSAQVAALRRAPACQIAYGRSYEEDHGQHPPQRRGPIRATGRPVATLFPLLLVERWWTTSSPLYRTSLLDRIGPWQPWINEEDWEYDARAGAGGAPLAWVPIDVSIRRLHLGDDHLSRDGCLDPRKLADRSRAQPSIHRCALQAGVTPDSPEMRRFARSAFLLCRQCGEAGLARESRQLFELSRQASMPSRRMGADFHLYAMLAAVLGWCGAARLTAGLHRLLRPVIRRPHGA